MEYYSATKSNGIRLFIEMWLDLETVIQNEVSQKEDDKYNMIFITYKSKILTDTNYYV